MIKTFISKYAFMKALYENREASGEIIFQLLESAKISKKDWESFVKEYKTKELKPDEHEQFQTEVIEFCEEFAGISFPVPAADNTGVEVNMNEVVCTTGAQDEG